MHYKEEGQEVIGEKYLSGEGACFIKGYLGPVYCTALNMHYDT